MEFYEVVYQKLESCEHYIIDVEAGSESEAEHNFYLIFNENDYVVCDIKVNHEFLFHGGASRG